MEIIGKEYRMGVGLLMAELFGVGLIVLAIIGFLSRNWIYTQLAISVPTLLFFFYFWLVPESPRWLLSRNRVSEAKAVILKAAKFNKVQLPNNFELEQEKTTTSNIKSLLKAKTLLARTLVTFLNWFTVAMAYYGLSLSAGTMEGNVYFITGLSGVMECLGVLAALPINKLGRKGPYIFGMILGGLACLAPVIVDKFGTDLDPNTRNNIYVVLNAIGKFGVSFAFCVIYIWSAEYYPTCLRTSLMGFSSTFARIGTIVSPFIAEIGKYVPPDQDKMLQSVIVGTITIGSGLTALILPETTGQSIPDTVEQANRMVSIPVTLFKKKTGDLELDEKFNDNDE